MGDPLAFQLPGKLNRPKMGKRLIRTPCAFTPVLFGQRKTEKICFFGYLYFISGAVGKSGCILAGGIVVHQYLIPILLAFQRFFRHQHQFPEGMPACVNDLCHFTSAPSYLLAETACAPVLAFFSFTGDTKAHVSGVSQYCQQYGGDTNDNAGQSPFFHRTHLFLNFVISKAEMESVVSFKSVLCHIQNLKLQFSLFFPEWIEFFSISPISARYAIIQIVFFGESYNKRLISAGKAFRKGRIFNMPPIYLDNASTAYPKALPVADTVRDYILNTKCNVNG